MTVQILSRRPGYNLGLRARQDRFAVALTFTLWLACTFASRALPLRQRTTLQRLLRTVAFGIARRHSLAHTRSAYVFVFNDIY